MESEGGRTDSSDRGQERRKDGMRGPQQWFVMRVSLRITVRCVDGGVWRPAKFAGMAD